MIVFTCNGMIEKALCVKGCLAFQNTRRGKIATRCEVAPETLYRLSESAVSLCICVKMILVV